MKLPDLIQINIPFIVILILAGLGALLSYVQYKKTLPEVRAGWRWSLAILRGLAVLLVLLVFFRPHLTVFYHQAKEKRIAVFVDRSQSMTVQDDSLVRWQEALRAVDKIRNLSGKATELNWYGFHSRVFAMSPDSVQPTLYGTNLLNVMKKNEHLSPDAAVLISDGNYTEGAYPAPGHAHIPLFIVGVGRHTTDADVFIQDVNFKPLAYQGKKQSIIARIGSRALKKGVKSTVYLKVDGKTVHSTVVHLTPQAPLRDVPLSYIPKKNGQVRLEVWVSGLPDEKNTANNRRTLVQKVLKGKIKVVVLSGAVDYESKILHLLLQAQEDVQCDLFAQLKNGRWVGGQKPQLNRCDVLILSNFPGPYSSSADVNQLLRQIQQLRCGLLFVTGKYVNNRLLELFKTYLPFSNMPRTISALPSLQISAKDNTPLLQLFQDQNTAQQFWQKVPPLEIFMSGGALEQDANVLLKGLTRRGDVPVLIVRKIRGQRSALFNGNGFWKWHFLLQDTPEIAKGYGNLLHLVVRWLSEKQKLQQVVLRSTEKIHYLGRPVHLKVHLFDAAYQPLSDGQVKIEVLWNKQTFYLDARRKRDGADSLGVFSASFVPPGEGKYVVNASGYRNELQLGKDRLIFEVIPFEKELLEVRQNSTLLREIANASGGKYVTVSGLDSLKEILNAPPQMVRIKKSFVLWDSLYLLLAVLGLIVLEWALRKFKGLA